MPAFKETIENIKRETLFSILRVVGLVLFLLVLGMSFILWQQWNAKREALPEAPKSQELTDGQLTDGQKKAILESLSAPAGGPQYTPEEKGEILQGLSAPVNQPTMSVEEKKKILDSLSTP